MSTRDAGVSQQHEPRRGEPFLVEPQAEIFDAVSDLVPREDRDLESLIVEAGIDARLRTAIGRACKATGVPLISPHDPRHRRATLMHLSGIPAAEAAGKLGHSPREHLRTYTHVVIDRRELDYSGTLSRDQTVLASVLA
jgi:integrase